ncbi:MAG: hypothetical protein ACOYD3_04585, partial [Kiritimatiellia bacterium]
MHPANNPSSPALYPAPTGLVVFSPITQGVALGWYISPLQGFHQLCRESFVGNFVAFVEGNRKAHAKARSRAKSKRVDEACRLRVGLREG